MKFFQKYFLLTPVFLGCLFLWSSEASAAVIYASTTLRNLISFDSANPGSLLSSVPISGAIGTDSIAGIDFRPANGTLYALGNAGGISRLYIVNLQTGVTTRVGSTDFNLPGTNFGVDFNPVPDRLRVVSDSNTSVRLNPNNGALAGTDTNLNPSSSVVAVAYDRNDTNPATLTTLFGIDAFNNELVRIGGVDGNPSPNDGLVTRIGVLGVDAAGSSSFDISSTGVAFASLTSSSLYTIDLTTGAATFVGQIGTGLEDITGLSAVTPVPEPTSVIVLGGLGLLLGLKARGKRSPRKTGMSDDSMPSE